MRPLIPVRNRVARAAAVSIFASTLLACWGKDALFFGVPERQTGPLLGGITGIVRNTGTGNGIGGVPVLVSGAAPVMTVGNGSYLVNNLTLGPREIRVESPPGMTCAPAVLVVTVIANQNVTADFGCVNNPGAITGTVTLNGTPVAGVVVTLDGGATTQTGANGTYTFTNVASGNHSVGVTNPPGTTCTPPSQSVSVSPGQTATANFACVTSTGSIAGQVRFQTSGLAGVVVQVGTVNVTADAQGNFQIGSIAPGSYTARVTSGTAAYLTCPDVNVVVVAGQVANVTIICVAIQFDFQLTPNFQHLGPGVSIVCVLIVAPTALAGAPYSASVTGPGVTDSGQHSNTLNPQARAAVQSGINRFGTYTWVVIILGVQKTVDINVGAGTNVCQQA